jgi:hypothetical protein
METRSSTAQHAGPPRPARSTTTLAGGCVNPIRLRGFHQRIAADTGELISMLGSPDGAGVIVVACKDRRASCCPACARLYERDAYQLVVAGLRGGKNVPESVGTHRAVMVTLTAPSFGAVHGNYDPDQSCRCGHRHDEDDPQLGTAIDPTNYRYTEQVIWNRYASALWKRTVQAIRRHLAQALGVPRTELAPIARVRFLKVAEFQRRGVVHYHAIVRVDGPGGPDDQPPTRCTTTVLETVVAAAADAASVTLSEALREAAPGMSPKLRWGAQREIVGLDANTCTVAAGYIAKYTTKATETATAGTLVKPIRTAGNLARLPVADHPRAIIAAAWMLGERTGDDTFKRWAHQFAYGGHAITKSHGYSVTFTALRRARADWHDQASATGEVIVRKQLTYAGRGHTSSRGPQ